MSAVRAGGSAAAHLGWLAVRLVAYLAFWLVVSSLATFALVAALALALWPAVRMIDADAPAAAALYVLVAGSAVFHLLWRLGK